MSVWRPRPAIRVIAIGLHWRGDALLAVEVRDDSGRIKGVRPLGGEIEFGERWDDALRREFREEIGVEISVSGPPIVMENLYMHHGSKGHEIVFVADVAFSDGAFGDSDALTVDEGPAGLHTARWFPFDTLDDSGPALFPAGLKARIAAVRGLG